MDAKETKAIINNLEKETNTKTILELLTVLKTDVKPTEKFLRETKVGVAVNKLRQNSNSEISLLAKKIVKLWKEKVSEEKKNKNNGNNSSNNNNNNSNNGQHSSNSNSKNSNGNDKDSTNKENSPSSPKKNSTIKTEDGSKYVTTKPRTPENDGIKVNMYDDSTRNGSIKGLYSALAIGSEVLPKSILKVSISIEEESYKLEYGKINDNYRNKMRSLIMNLRNKNNPELRKRVLNHEIQPSKFVKMTNQEMAPESLKETIKKLHQENLFNAQGAVEKKAVTDRFVCGKCKKREVSYYQMQTRSADEPLTTFCTCENCGNRWKFC
ncbi:hypothetical protein BVG19_g643 [[Candida] boidinii]|nr:hypothetical protein BVG19_g643 [[Candida] boidinii]OWB51905.1 nucleic acid binding protein [[Candida] boidinii]